ncbi:uncharacterized protein VTP21DRAFT_4818 [Calcarisporiella thermophila]|uniref:uncharacterized protein n=1 Tax=Calcarisporiella thermophila TaxID=911321 RepID=UPI0037444812
MQLQAPLSFLLLTSSLLAFALPLRILPSSSYEIAQALTARSCKLLESCAKLHDISPLISVAEDEENKKLVRSVQFVKRTPQKWQSTITKRKALPEHDSTIQLNHLLESPSKRSLLESVTSFVGGGSGDLVELLPLLDQENEGTGNKGKVVNENQASKHEISSELRQDRPGDDLLGLNELLQNLKKRGLLDSLTSSLTGDDGRGGSLLDGVPLLKPKKKKPKKSKQKSSKGNSNASPLDLVEALSPFSSNPEDNNTQEFKPEKKAKSREKFAGEQSLATSQPSTQDSLDTEQGQNNGLLGNLVDTVNDIPIISQFAIESPSITTPSPLAAAPDIADELGVLSRITGSTSVPTSSVDAFTASSPLSSVDAPNSPQVVTQSVFLQTITPTVTQAPPAGDVPVAPEVVVVTRTASTSTPTQFSTAGSAGFPQIGANSLSQYSGATARSNHVLVVVGALAFAVLMLG